MGPSCSHFEHVAVVEIGAHDRVRRPSVHSPPTHTGAVPQTNRDTTQHSVCALRTAISPTAYLPNSVCVSLHPQVHTCTACTNAYLYCSLCLLRCEEDDVAE